MTEVGLVREGFPHESNRGVPFITAVKDGVVEFNDHGWEGRGSSRTRRLTTRWRKRCARTSRRGPSRCLP